MVRLELCCLRQDARSYAMLAFREYYVSSRFALRTLMIVLKPTTLEGHGVQLEPMTAEHADDLAAAVTDGKLWELWFTVVPEPDKVGKYIADAISPQGH